MSTLSQARIDTAGGGTRLVLQFLGSIPYYSVSGNGPTSLTILLQGVTRSPSGLGQLSASGLISAAELSQTALGVQVHVALASPARAQVSRIGSQLIITFSADHSYQRPSPNPSVAIHEPAPTQGEPQQVAVVSLKYADVSEVAALLGSQLQAQPEDLGSVSVLSQNAQPINGSQGYQPAPASPANLSVTGFDSLRINEHATYDRRLNAIVLTGSAQDISYLKSLLSAIDVPDASSASVMLETEIVELDEDAARRVGIDVTNNGGAAVSADLGSVSGSKPNASATLQAQLFAEIASGNGTLLARPRIQTLNGQPASILTGDALPIITTITYPGSPPTVQQQIQYVNVGVHLVIQPHISALGYVTTRIVSEVSNVTAFVDGSIPQISQRQAIATARVKDGQPYVIGGLLQDNEIREMSKIPFVGDLPIIGSLFRAVKNSHRKTNLYIVVTPRIQTIP